MKELQQKIFEDMTAVLGREPTSKELEVEFNSVLGSLIEQASEEIYFESVAEVLGDV
jgi:hypothetical protein